MSRIVAKKLKPIRNNVFVSDLDHGERRTKGGIIITDDDMKDWGIHPRWGKVFAVGPDVEDIRPGEWIYIEHGRWTHGLDLQLPSGTIRLWRVEYPKAVMLATDFDPRENRPAS